MSSAPFPAAVLFDLDGTLIDSLPDIHAATNLLLDESGRPPLAIDDVRAMIGHGVRMLVSRIHAARDLPGDEAALDAATARMMAIQAEHLTGLTTLLPGALDALRLCREAGAKTAIVTNKPERFSRIIAAHYGLMPMVDLIVGGDTGPARKPAPDMLLHAAATLGAVPASCVMVGDSAADIDAAKAAGIASIAVRGGYGRGEADALGADLVLDSLADLTPDALCRAARPV